MSLAFRLTRFLAAPKKAWPPGEAPLNFRSARRRLAQHGVKALLPSVHPKFKDGEQNVAKLSVKERVWHPPMISRRKISVLRKQAKIEGTYGSFDPETLRGWDPQWDLELAMSRPRGTGRYMRLRVPRRTRQHRSREERAQKIEANMVGMDERMEALQAERHAKKEPDTVMNRYKKIMKKVQHTPGR